MSFAADQNLLFGVLALQMDAINRNQLIDALHQWVADKQRTLGELLVASAAMDDETRQLLEGLMRKRIQQHEGDVAGSLASFATLESSLKEQLMLVNDRDVSRTVSAIPPARWNGVMAAGQGGDERRFSILRFHAQGGLGEVYIAEDRELHRDVALKLVKQDYADRVESRSRFVTEAEITAGLEHPNIVPVYGLGEGDDGRPYYAMKFIRGESLRKRIDQYHYQIRQRELSAKAQSLGLRELLGHFVDTCQAVEYAHSRGVIHRDLKPANVMLGRYGETLVVDWGLAKALGRDEQQQENNETTLQPSSREDSSETMYGRPLGTMPFASPEQVAGKLDEVGPASDVYSLGATLYVILTGKSAFRGTQQEIVDNVLAGVFPRPRQVNPLVPAALEAICVKAMSYRPEHRYGSPTQLANDIGAWLADEPVEAYTDPFTTRWRRWVKRHRGLAAGTAASIVVTLVGSVIGLVLLSDMNRQLETRNSELEKANTEIQNKNYLIQNQNQEINEQKNQITEDRDRIENAYETETRLSANLAARRGQWNDVLRIVDQAIAEGHQDPVARRLDRVKALYGLIRTEECGQEVDALYALTDKAGHDAEIDLWYGDMLLLKHDAEPAKKFIQQALERGLAPADEYYARALLEPKTDKAVEHLEAALEKDRYHQRAYHYLIANLIMLGRREEARENITLGRILFPDDCNLTLLSSWEWAMEGDADSSIAALRDLRPILNDQDFRLAERLFRGLAKSVNTMDHWERGLSWKEMYELGRMVIDFQRLGTSGIHSDKTQFPLSMEFRPGGSAVAAYSSLLKMFGWKTALTMSIGVDVADDLTKMTPLHPDGFLHFVRAQIYFTNDRITEARDAYAAASKLPALIPNVQREALYCLCMTEQLLFLQTKEEERLDAALDALRRRLQCGPMSSPHSSNVIKLCLKMNELDLARTIIRARLKETPEDVAWQLRLADVERRDSNLLLALRLVERALEQDPQNVPARTFREETLAMVRQSLEKLSPSAESTPEATSSDDS